MSVYPLNLEIENVNIIGGYFIYSLVTLPDGDMLFTGNKTGLWKGDNLNQIFKLNKDSGEVTVYAGTAEKGNNDGLALQASFNVPSNLALLSDGSVVVTDYRNHLIRHISPSSAKMRSVITIAGDKSGKGFFLDGPALYAKFNNPYSLCIDINDNIYIYDCKNNRIRCLKDGIVTTVGGDGTIGNGEDGPALSVGLSHRPLHHLACDSNGNIFFSTGNSCNSCTVVKKLDLESKIITTIAGKHNNSKGGVKVYSILVVDALDNIYVVENYVRDDYVRLRLRKVSNDGMTSTLIRDEVNFNFGCVSVSVDNFGNLIIPAWTHSANTIRKVKLNINTASPTIATANLILTNLIENPKATKADIKFNVQGTIIEAHQNILIAVSPVFMKLLSDDFRESQEGKVIITDTTPEAFQALLNIIYTDDKAKYCNDEVVCDLYFLAKKYMFGELENYCEFQIKKSSAEHLIQRFIWADTHVTLTDFREYLKIQIAKKFNEIKEKYPYYVKALMEYSKDLTLEIMMSLNVK